MESRIKRNERRKKRLFSGLIKFIILICLVGVLVYLLFGVNDSIREFNLIENPNLIEINLANKSISIFGETYYVK